jgi:isoprenylcysteine carboxyl methyltransferase (ICMT) family protein YpbQ
MHGYGAMEAMEVMEVMVVMEAMVVMEVMVVMEAMVVMEVILVSVVYQKSQAAWNVSICLVPTNSIATSNYFNQSYISFFIIQK